MPRRNFPGVITIGLSCYVIYRGQFGACRWTAAELPINVSGKRGRRVEDGDSNFMPMKDIMFSYDNFSTLWHCLWYPLSNWQLYHNLIRPYCDLKAHFVWHYNKAFTSNFFFFNYIFALTENKFIFSYSKCLLLAIWRIILWIKNYVCA